MTDQKAFFPILVSHFSSFTLQYFLNFNDVQCVHRVLVVELLEHAFVDEAIFGVGLGEHLAADEDCLGLVKDGGSVFVRNLHPRFFDFVFVPARNLAEIGEFLAEFFAEEVEREAFCAIHEFLGVAGLADGDVGDRLVPHDADSTPAGGHGVRFPVFFGGDEHPVLADELKWVRGEFR